MQKEPEVAAMISESWLRWDDEGVEDDDDLLKGGMFEELGAFLASDSDASSSLLDGLQLPGSVGGGELLVSSSPLVMDLDILDAGVLPPVVGADGQIDDADVSTAAEGTAEMKSSPVPHPQPAAARQPGSSPPKPRRAEHGSAAAASAAAPGSGDCAAAAAQLPGPNAAAVGVPEMMVPAGLGMAVSWPVSPEAMLSVFHQLSPAAESAPYLPLQMLAAGNTALPPACLPPASSVPDWQSAFRPPLSCQAVLPFLGCTAPVLGSVAPLPSATTTGVPVTEAPAIPEQRNSARVAGWGGAPLARRQSDCSSDLGCSDPEAVAAGSSTRDGDSQSAAEVGLVPVDPRASEQGVAEVPAADATDAAPKPEPAWPGIPIPQSIAPSHGGVLPAPLAPFTAALPVAAMMSHGGRLLSQCRSRQECLKRYKAKRAQRAKTKKIRYHLRKLNADSRPRWKGRFVKKEDVPAVLASQREERRERLEFPDDDALHLSLALPDVDILQMRDATGVLDEALLLLDRTAL